MLHNYERNQYNTFMVEIPHDPYVVCAYPHRQPAQSALPHGKNTRAIGFAGK